MFDLKKVIESVGFENFENIINSIPSSIFFKDKNLVYRFCSKFWKETSGQDPTGKTDWEIRKDKENVPQAEAADKAILATGKGIKYVIKSEDSYLELIKEPVKDSKGDIIGIVGLINDVTERTMLQLELQKLSSYDTLTGLLNRQAGTRQIQEHLSKPNTRDAFCLLDLNRFKYINDTYGHQIGDLVLVEFAKVIKDSVRNNDICMRLGGDEFIILLNNIKNTFDAENFAKRLCKNIKSIKIEGVSEDITASIGIKIIAKGDTFDSLYAYADKSMYEAKKRSDSYYVIN